MTTTIKVNVSGQYQAVVKFNGAASKVGSNEEKSFSAPHGKASVLEIEEHEYKPDEQDGGWPKQDAAPLKSVATPAGTTPEKGSAEVAGGTKRSDQVEGQ